MVKLTHSAPGRVIGAQFTDEEARQLEIAAEGHDLTVKAYIEMAVRERLQIDIVPMTFTVCERDGTTRPGTADDMRKASENIVRHEGTSTQEHAKVKATLAAVAESIDREQK